jgi:cytochrome c biogenesis protein CcdA
MTSLSNVYERDVGEVASRRRVFVGLSLFAVGAVAVVAGIVLATTSVGQRLGLSVLGARELAGVLAGLGVPAAFLGSFTVLPSSGRTQAGAVIGGGLAVFGVSLFAVAYPANWVGSTAVAPDYTLPVVVVYFLGVITTFWCLFLAVANFKTRNDPGGTVRMEVTEGGTTRILEVTGSVPGFGGVGLFGTDTETGVETQTNTGDGGEVLYARDENPTPARGTGTASDGGAATAEATADAEPVPDEVVEAAQTRGRPDPYCGNCQHFQYVRVDGEIRPACTLNEVVMNDMEACDEWAANS